VRSSLNPLMESQFSVCPQYLQAHLSFSLGRDRCTNWSAAETHAAQQCRYHHERVWESEFESQATGKLKGRSDGDSARTAKCWATSKSRL